MKKTIHLLFLLVAIVSCNSSEDSKNNEEPNPLETSKDILDAFVTLDEKLSETMENFDKKNEEIYSRFDEVMADPDKRKETEIWSVIAKKIRKVSDTAYNYLDSIKTILIQTVENGEFNDHEITTKLMIGDNPKRPNGIAFTVHDRINRLRNNLTELISNYKLGNKKFSYSSAKPYDFDNTNPDDTAEINLLHSNLTIPDKVWSDLESDSVYWEANMFDHAPVVAALAILTALQADIRNAEAEALEHIFAHVNADEYNFNKIEPIAYSKKQYLNQGDSSKMQIFMAAFDTIPKDSIKMKDK